jgi:hypothetical protein
MELVDRYLQAVRFWLPKAQQEDILAELSEDIRSQIEDKEAELGRKLNEAEVEVILQRWGNPALVAERFRPRRQLIGPGLFPEYWRVLRIVLGVTALVFTFLIVTVLAGGKPLPKAFLMFPGIWFAEFGWLTFVYAVRERFYRPENWNPRSLPRIAKAEGKRPSQSVYELAITAFFSVWWLAGLRFPYLIFGPFFKFAPVWRAFYVPILLLSLAEIARQSIGLLRPQSTRFLGVARLAINSASLVVCYLLLRAGNLVDITDAVRSWGELSTRAWWVVGISITASLYLGLVIAAIISALVVLRELWRLIRSGWRRPVL